MKKCKTLEDKIAAAKGDYNFDHPNAFDWDLMQEVLAKIRDGKPVDVPHYCFVQHKRVPGSFSVALFKLCRQSQQMRTY